MNRSGSFSILGFLCILGISVGSAARPILGEPVAPVPEVNESWIVSEHLVPGWQSMALTTRHYNPEGPSWIDKTPGRSLSFEGQIDVIDSNGLIGLWEAATNAKAFDELGNPIHVVGAARYPLDHGYPSQVPSYQPLRHATTLGAGGRTMSHAPYTFSIDMSMTPDAPFPLVLSRLEWSMSVLLGDTFEVVDIPFAPTADWIELTPGLEVLMEQATVQEGRYSYQLKARYDPNKISYLDAREKPPGFMGRRYDAPYTWPDQAFPEMIVTAIDVVDAQGESIWDKRMQPGHMGFGTGSGFSDSGDQRIATRTGVGFCSECGRAAFIRHVIAFKPYDQEVQFALENVPVPGL